MDPMTKNLYFKIFKRNENICPQEDLSANIQNRLKPEATQMSINEGTDKQIVEYSSNQILLHNENGIDTQKNIELSERSQTQMSIYTL